jgi:molybdopterin/thiamine biosynthesis adenylyltransferase/molybdopterin synthase catalytic subunit/rhodanese-related sulfurtransferase
MKPFFFSSSALRPEDYRAALGDPAAGGYSSFEGWVRNHNEGLAVTRLEYEAFEALAIKEGERIVTEAIERFGVINAACVHRVGSLAIGEMAVWVGVSSRHRAEAFAACRYIIDEVKHRVPIWKKEHYVTGDSGWVNCERCAVHGQEHHEHHHDHEHVHEHAASIQAPSPTPRARPDYSRQIALKDVGTAGQEKLRSARVLVIGAGGLGVPVLNYLAGAGVGTLGICESDSVDASNLHRQPLYSLSDVGKPKAQLAADRLTALNPEVLVRTHERIGANNAAQLLADYDLVVECSDNFATKFLVNDAAVRARKPAVFASVYQYEGQLQVYRPEGDSACLRCLWPEATRDGLVGNCSEAGVLGPVPGILGSMQALEALKLMLGLPGQLKNEMLLIDLLTLEQRKLRAARRVDCDHEARKIEVATTPDLEVSFADLKPAVAAGYTVIDIRDDREVSELPLAQTPSRHIPLASLIADASALRNEDKYLLVCARGMRSRAAAEHLRERGFQNAYSLRGGVAALR